MNTIEEREFEVFDVKEEEYLSQGEKRLRLNISFSNGEFITLTPSQLVHEHRLRVIPFKIIRNGGEMSVIIKRFLERELGWKIIIYNGKKDIERDTETS